MFVVIDLAAGESASLEEPDNFKQFHLLVRGDGGPDEIDAALRSAGVGTRDGDDAFLDVEAVRGLAGAGRGAEWDAQFAAMLEYAASKGWMSDDGQAVRAHVERANVEEAG